MYRMFAGVLAALIASSSAQAATVYGIDLSGRLVTFDSATPGTLTSSTAISGLIASAILGIDFRPATGQLYALGGNSQLYTINTFTGAATAVGAGNLPLSGSNFGFDFNPTVDRIRVVSVANQNLRLNPVTGGLAATDTNLSYGNATTPQVSSVAYTNNFAGATSTTLYALDYGLDTLARIGSVGASPISPNTGQLTTIGALGFDINGDASFDISTVGDAFVSSGFNFYSVNLATGAATLIGSTAGLRNIAVAPIVPEPGTWAMMIAGFGLVGGAMRRRRVRVACA